MICAGTIFSTLLLAFVATDNIDSDRNNIISMKMADSDGNVISRLRSLGMHKKESTYHTDLGRRASILIPMFFRADTKSTSETVTNNHIHVLFTQRPKTMKSHGGEVCFPGGKQDPCDEGNDIITALREANEEIGLHDQYVEIIARMEALESKHALCVSPIIGLIKSSSKAEPSQLKLNTDEVEAAFAVPLKYFVDPDNCNSIEKVQWRGEEFLLRTYLYDDPESGRQFKIWGLTAHVIHLVATHAFGKTKP